MKKKLLLSLIVAPFIGCVAQYQPVPKTTPAQVNNQAKAAAAIDHSKLIGHAPTAAPAKVTKKSSHSRVWDDLGSLGILLAFAGGLTYAVRRIKKADTKTVTASTSAAPMAINSGPALPPSTPYPAPGYDVPAPKHIVGNPPPSQNK